MNTSMSRLRGKLLGLGGGMLLLMAAGVGHAGTVTYVYTDPQGTPLAEANASGTITATFDYAPYGSIALGTAPNGPGYTGHVNDPDTGLVYMQARYYDPSVGRFLSTDPTTPTAGDAFNFSRYAYANNNPVMHIDPDGRQSTDVCSIVPCISVKMNGTIQRIPSAVGPQEFLAQQSGSSISAYTNTTLPSRVDSANALDKVSLGATVVTFATALDAPPVAAGAAVVDESAAFGALLLDPNLPRFGNVLTAGAFGMLKAVAKGTEAAAKSVEQAEQASRAVTILHATHEAVEPSSTDSIPPTPTPTPTPSPTLKTYLGIENPSSN